MCGSVGMFHVHISIIFCVNEVLQFNLYNKPFLIEYCEYKGVQYNQGQTWQDGCDYTCRCDNVEKGLYTCNQR